VPGPELMPSLSETTVLDPHAPDPEEESISTPFDTAGPLAERTTTPVREWNAHDREAHMARLIEAAGRDIDQRLARLPEFGDIELTDTQVRVLHAAMQMGGPVWAHKIFLQLIAEGDEPSAEAVRKTMERLAKLGLLTRSEHPVPSPDGAARWIYEVVQPVAAVALERERLRRLMLVQRLGSYPEGLRHVLLNQTLDNSETDPVPEPEPSGIG
jgi:hypothetical protein